MKTLYIVRHAKSSWDYPGLQDYQRPLLEKGKKRTKHIVDYLQEKNVRVDLIMSSHATRAFETAKIIAKALKYPEDKIMISKSIYHSDSDGLFNLFFDLSDNIHALMIVGHNPTLTYFANLFLERKLDNLPTSGIVCIDFKTDNWESIASSGRITKFVVSPRSLKSRNARK